MAGTNTKRIEETATSALKSALLHCQYLDSYINSNDKTPSWDGTIFVYRDVMQRSSDLLGRVPIQIKGTTQQIVSSTATFSCSITDLRNYYNDGGCIFFLVSVDLLKNWHHIYFASFLTFDLGRLLKEAGKQTSYTIKLSTFPENDQAEIFTIFNSFVQNKPKQMSLIGKDILTLEGLQKKGTAIEYLSLCGSGINIKYENIESFITTHDFYLYAKPQGLDIEIPVDKISNAIVSRTVDASVSVDGYEYYPFYSVIYEKGQPTINIGKGITFCFNCHEKKSTISLKPKGTLTDFIRDASFFIDVIKKKQFTLNGINCPLSGLSVDNPGKYEDSLVYYKEVKKTLDILGVIEELQCDHLSDKDETNLRNLVSAVLYNRRIRFSNVDFPNFYWPLMIANLKILIWASRQPNGDYILDTFFNEHPVALFESTDEKQEYPIRASHYLLLDKDAFIHSSNMDYDKLFISLTSVERKDYFIQQVVLLMLEMLKAYDEQQKKDEALLNLADRVCDWIAVDKSNIEPDIILLNKMQIAKRRRSFTPDELVSIVALKASELPCNIRCAAYLLLDDPVNAQNCFNEMERSVQESFLAFPICIFGNLKIKTN
ncbi:MAG: hypothetical protein VB086_06685 [Clostridiaceae bacterium]|nr:hypothetical protein [Clostridiaceae bacterium]